MAYSEYQQLDLQFSNFTFQGQENSSDSLLECEIEEIPPHCRSVSMADLHQLACNLRSTSLDQQPSSAVDFEQSTMTDGYVNSLAPSIIQRHISRPLPSSDSQDSRFNSLRTQRKNLARSQTQRSYLLDVEALVRRLDSAPRAEFLPPAKSTDRPFSAALDALLEEKECNEVPNNQSSDVLACQMGSFGYRRSCDFKPERNWVEKPIRKRKNHRRRK